MPKACDEGSTDMLAVQFNLHELSSHVLFSFGNGLLQYNYWNPWFVRD